MGSKALTIVYVPELNILHIQGYLKKIYHNLFILVNIEMIQTVGRDSWMYVSILHENQPRTGCQWAVLDCLAIT